MMTTQKRKGPGAAATAPRARFVASSKPTELDSSKTALDASAYARAWVARGHRIKAEGPAGSFTVTGQVAKALVALVRAGARGVTALETATWAFRLAAYVHQLRRDCGLAIETIREEHNGGWHARYRLLSAVRLEPIQ